MPDVALIRPGWTDFDEQSRIQGSLELPLSVSGQEQVQSLVRQLVDVRLNVVFSAACEPARSTALAICDECGVPHKELAELTNLNHGLWQGLQVDEVRRKYPKVFKQWQESPETVRLPEGETVAEAVDRIRRALRKCLKRKRAVGIVAAEPLATLIGCVLRGCRPKIPDVATKSQPDRKIEFFLACNQSKLDDSMRAATARPGAPLNGTERIEGDSSENLRSAASPPDTNGAKNGRPGRLISVDAEQSASHRSNRMSTGDRPACEPNGSGRRANVQEGPSTTPKGGVAE